MSVPKITQFSARLTNLFMTCEVMNSLKLMGWLDIWLELQGQVANLRAKVDQTIHLSCKKNSFFCFVSSSLGLFNHKIEEQTRENLTKKLKKKLK